jgi:hypothetical protein
MKMVKDVFAKRSELEKVQKTFFISFNLSLRKSKNLVEEQ